MNCPQLVRLSAILLPFLQLLSVAAAFSNVSGSLNPVRLIENEGQVQTMEGRFASEVLFSIEGCAADIFLTRSGLTYVYRQVDSEDDRASVEYRDKSRRKKICWSRIDMTLIGASIDASKISKEGPSAESLNFYLAHCPAGITGVKSYEAILIRDIYPGIDWRIYSMEGMLKYDYLIHPGASPSMIHWNYGGAEKIEITEKGQLLIRSALGTLTEEPPALLQGTNTISGRYHEEGMVFGFETGPYDVSQDMIIDPVTYPALGWGTYVGGNSLDGFNSITKDAAGNIFVGGYSNSGSYPTVDQGSGSYYQGTNMGNVDIVLIKFSASGAMMWCTLYGGLNGDWANSVAVDPSGNLYVTGVTASANLPMYTLVGAYNQAVYGGGTYDSYCLRFSNSGVREWATYFGGSDSDLGTSSATDASGNFFVSGQTFSTNFPVLNPGGGAHYQSVNAGQGEIYVAKFSPACVQLWTTYYGGTGLDGGNTVSNSNTSLALDPSGSIYVFSYTTSTNLPLQNPGGGAYYQPAMAGVEDAALLKFSNTGIRQWATYLGGNASEGSYGGCAVTADASGNVTCAGLTASTNYPTVNPGGGAYYQAANAGSTDLFLTKFNAAGSIIWSTYFGGSGAEGYQIWRDQEVVADPSNGDLFVTGQTNSTNFPTLNPGNGSFFDGTIGPGGTTDGFLLQFNNNGALQWSTYNGQQQTDFGAAIMLHNDCLFAVGEWIWSSQPGLMNPGGGAYYDGTANGSDDSFIMKFCSSTVLASELEYFGVTNKPFCNELRWRTAINSDFVHFDVERAGGGEGFEKIGEEDNTSGSRQEFSLLDRSPLRGMNFYRLKIGTAEGSFSYSEVISIENQSSDDVVVFPNPIGDLLNVEWKGKKELHAGIILQDLAGKIILQSSVQLSADHTIFQISAETLAPGIYLLKFEMISGETMIYKVVKPEN